VAVIAADKIAKAVTVAAIAMATVADKIAKVAIAADRVVVETAVGQGRGGNRGGQGRRQGNEKPHSAKSLSNES